MRKDKHGAISASHSPILQRLKIDPDTWVQIATTFEDSAGAWVGSPERLQQTCKKLDKRWICQSKKVVKLYPR